MDVTETPKGIKDITEAGFDANFTRPIEGLIESPVSQKRVENRLTTAEQDVIELKEQWLSLNPSTIAGINAASKQITLQKVDVDARFALGDKIRYFQDGAFKYAFVTRKSGQVIEIEGGDNYVLTGSAITQLDYSRDVTPIGFPTIDRFVKSGRDIYFDNGSTLEVTWVTRTINFEMRGAQVIVYYNFVGTVSATGAQPYTQLVYLEMPITRATTSEVASIDFTSLAYCGRPYATTDVDSAAVFTIVGTDYAFPAYIGLRTLPYDNLWGSSVTNVFFSGRGKYEYILIS